MMLEVRIAVPMGGEWRLRGVGWAEGAWKLLEMSSIVMRAVAAWGYIHELNILDKHTSLDVYQTSVQPGT